MTLGNEVVLYPGGNTSQGFYSFYNYIINDYDATKIYVIKGGPGVGKSTFMKKIAADLTQAGYDVELHYCSSDNNSLDGLVIPKLRVALLDGTSPHVVDPKHPGAVDTILHLGDFWNEKEMRENKEAIFALTRKYQRCFRRAYGYFKAASVFWKELNSYYADLPTLDTAGLRKNIQEIINNIFSSVELNDKQTEGRHLFASAITPQGLVNSLETLVSRVSKKIIVQEPRFMRQGTLITLALQQAELLGLAYTAFHCALHPDKIEHVFIPQLDLMIVTSNDFHRIQPDNEDAVLPIDKFIDWDVLEDVRDERETLIKHFNECLLKGIEFIGKAKKEHDQLETNYVPNMDFDAVEKLRVRTVKEILGFAE